MLLMLHKRDAIHFRQRLMRTQLSHFGLNRLAHFPLQPSPSNVIPVLPDSKKIVKTAKQFINYINNPINMIWKLRGLGCNKQRVKKSGLFFLLLVGLVQLVVTSLYTLCYFEYEKINKVGFDVIWCTYRAVSGISSTESLLSVEERWSEKKKDYPHLNHFLYQEFRSLVLLYPL